MRVEASAPGNLMLMGEHAVLHNELALALAVDKRVRVRLQTIAEPKIRIHSQLQNYECALDQIVPDPKLSFATQALLERQGRFPSGFELFIESEFSHEVGLGSSAAVTIALVAVLDQFIGESCEPRQIFDRALGLVHRVQNGRGSGTDLAASLLGGIVAYRVQPRRLERLEQSAPITLHYVGYKMKTPEAIERVEALSGHHPDLYSQLYRLMGQTTERAEQAIRLGDWAECGRLMNLYSGLMDALGVCDLSLAELQYRLRAVEGVLGSKISGSGLGDSVLTLGLDSIEIPGFQQIPVKISPRGLEVSVDG